MIRIIFELMKKYLCIATFSFIVMLFFVLNAQGGSFRLDINDVSGLDDPWPLVASIPFPEGELSDVSAIRITGGGREVPSQIDVAARWRDGSIRWALGGFTASPQGEYTVEYGEGVKRGVHTVPLKVSRRNGGFVVNTGAAEYRFDADKLLPESGYMVAGGSRIEILRGSGDGAYLVDNSGRRGVVSGVQAEVENKVLKEGPGRFVVKRSGYYVSGEGERLARAEAWFYFSAGSPYVRITHRIIFTEDTNKVWFKDYGLEFKTPVSPRRVFCALGEPGKENIREVNAQGSEVYLLQDQYPHFAEREYRAVIGKSSGGKDAVIEEIPVAGDWAHGDYGNYGITLAMPWLAQRFPKELSFGDGKVRAVLWSGRSKRELDFRGRTLAEEYWQEWVKISGRAKEVFYNWPSNAQGSARTHDVWLLPHAGRYNELLVRKAAAAGARVPLVMAEPGWLCATDAMGQPMLHKDTERFPAEEAAISEYWQRFILPMRAFPTNGFISWRHFPFWGYRHWDGKLMSFMTISSDSDPYGMRREPWILYARSGERTYYDYAHGFSRLTGDWYICHWDVPGNPDIPAKRQGKERGGGIFPGGNEARGMPFFWGDYTNRYYISSGVVSNWLFEYYLTGDESSKDLLDTVKEKFKQNRREDGNKPLWEILGGLNSIKFLRTMVTLSIMDWDEEINREAKELAHVLIDMESQNGVSSASAGKYGRMYKDARNSRNLLEYYIETGDELAKEGFLKLMDQRYRFNRLYNQVGYKTYEGLTFSAAYWMTGDERYRRAAEQTVRDALLGVKTYPLSRELERFPEDPLDWTELPENLKIWQCFNAMMGLPTALKLIAEKGWSNKPFPLVAKSMEATGGQVLFEHRQGRDTELSLYFFSLRPDIMPEVFRYPHIAGGKPLAGIKVEMEKRMRWPEFLRLREDDIYHASVTVPADTPGGLYLVSIGGTERFDLLDATAEKVALFCPEGFWPVCGTPIQRSGDGEYGRMGEGMPMFFRVPEGIEELNIFIGLPVRIKRPDGSVALDMSDENTGELSVPVEGKGGIWSIEPFLGTFRGDCPPAFYKLLNVEPVVAFGFPGFLPEGTTGKPVVSKDAPPAADRALEFNEGISGKAVRLPQNCTLTFPLGEKLPQGGHANFPGMTGTVEFWFRASRSTHENSLPISEDFDTLFLKSPHLNFRHRYMRRGVSGLYSLMQLELEPDERTLTSRDDRRFRYGTWGTHFFKGGEWVHVAYTWDIKRDEKGMGGDLSIFLNGKKLSVETGFSHFLMHYKMRQLTGSQVFKLSDAGEEIILGPFEGSMDMLRISDVVRYTEDFQPEKEGFEMDVNTKALFLFDGSLHGMAAFSKEGIEATLQGD